MSSVEIATEAIDQLISTDIGSRGVVGRLYDAARAVIGRPLTLAAGEALTSALSDRGAAVIISTGATCQRVGVDPTIGEADGPPGAIGLARALGRTGAVPVILTEEAQVEPLKQVARSGGLTPTTLEGAISQAGGSPYNSAVVVKPFPDVDDAAKRVAREILDSVRPKAIVTIERTGMNEFGIYHSSFGQDRSEKKARVDYLVQAAKSSGILTIGVGDGGNEIGMGLIADAVREHTTYGKSCRCGCGGGIVPITATDVLVVSAVSNWGAYGIAAALALLRGDKSIAHTPNIEERLVRATADVGYLDATGYTDYKVDGLPIEAHVALVQLLYLIVDQPLAWGARPTTAAGPGVVRA